MYSFNAAWPFRLMNAEPVAQGLSRADAGRRRLSTFGWVPA